MEEDFGQYSKKTSTTERVIRIQQKIKKKETKDPEDLMLIIMSELKEDSLYPEVGKFYTFVYNPKTSNIQYDQHPLIVCTSLHKWGFKGFNFHWRKSRQYTWEEVSGKLFSIKYNELDELLAIPYGKFRINK